jgi:hypothetical protein
MLTWTLFWKNGKREVIHGTDLDDALTNNGHTMESVKNTQFYTQGRCKSYEYDEETKEWIHKSEVAAACL